jgi:hypothetical protein
MYRDELQKLEGVWIGNERITESGKHYEASARLVFQTVFDGRFLVCDYIQTVPDRPTSVGHGVFRSDDRTNKLTVTWFRSPVATPTQQADAVAEGDKLVFLETIAQRTTRTTYSVVLDRMSVRTECSMGGDVWSSIFEGTYRRR